MTVKTRPKEDTVSAPFIFIGTHTFREGKLEEFKVGLKDFFEFVEANEPRMIAINFYVNEEGSELSVVQVHPDAASMEFHMQLLRERIKSSTGAFFDTKGIQVYGAASDGVLEMMRQLASAGAPLSVNPVHLGGFTRTQAEVASVTNSG